MTLKLGLISGPFQKNFNYRHHVDSRVKLYVSRKESFPIPLKCIDVTRTGFTSLVVMLLKNIDDYWNADGDRELSDTWTGFTTFIMLDEKSWDGYAWIVGDWQENKRFASLIQIMKNSRISWRIHAESWKFRCLLQCHSKTHWEKSRETCGFKKKRDKIRLHCRSQRVYEEGSLNKYHKDHLARKGMNSLNHFNLELKIASYV